MAPEAHSRFGGSSIDRWSTCPGSVTVDDPHESNEHADRGSAMHWVAEQALVHPDHFVEDYIAEFIDVNGRNILFTKEMADNTRFYTNYVETILSEYLDKSFTFNVEEKVTLASYGEQYASIFGTADVVINELFGDLVVIDLKGGKGISVPADSQQLRYYAAMAADGMIKTYERIRCIIVQPSDPYGEQIKEHIYTGDEIDQWMWETVLPAINEGRSDNPTFQPSEKACRWCPARGKCEHQAKMAFAIAAKEFESFTDIDLSDPVPAKVATELASKEFDGPEQIAEILRWVPFLEDWISAIRDEATRIMMNGGGIPEYKLVEGRTKRIWMPGIDIGEVLYKDLKFRKKDIYTTKINSPTAMLKLVSKRKLERLEKLIHKPKGRPTVAHVSDKRPAIEQMDEAKDDFAEMLK